MRLRSIIASSVGSVSRSSPSRVPQRVPRNDNFGHSFVELIGRDFDDNIPPPEPEMLSSVRPLSFCFVEKPQGLIE